MEHRIRQGLQAGLGGDRVEARRQPILEGTSRGWPKSKNPEFERTWPMPRNGLENLCNKPERLRLVGLDIPVARGAAQNLIHCHF
jgi:hypothetical protein